MFDASLYKAVVKTAVVNLSHACMQFYAREHMCVYTALCRICLYLVITQVSFMCKHSTAVYVKYKKLPGYNMLSLVCNFKYTDESIHSLDVFNIIRVTVICWKIT